MDQLRKKVRTQNTRNPSKQFYTSKITMVKISKKPILGDDSVDLLASYYYDSYRRNGEYEKTDAL